MRGRWTETASNDLLLLYDYLFVDSSDKARETIRKLVLTADRLQDFPKLGRPGTMPETRELVIPPFIVVYQIMEGVVSIETVLHSSRNYAGW